MKTASKALAAAFSAVVAAAAAALTVEVPATSDGWVRVALLAVAAGVGAFTITYAAPANRPDL
jgi:hypothetical protein